MVEVGTEGLPHAGRGAGANWSGCGGWSWSWPAKNGLGIAAAGHAPVLVVDDAGDHAARALPRRASEDMQDLAQQLLIFGTHVHIGIEDREFLIDAMNVARYLLPHVLCAVDQLAVLDGPQHRAQVVPQHRLPQLPAHRHPAASLASWAEFDELVDDAGEHQLHPRRLQDLVGRAAAAGAIPTLEFRICDVCTRVDEAVCIAAIFQAIIAKLWKLRRDNMTFRVSTRAALIEENKWRAVRYGLDGKLIDFGKERGAAGPRADPRADRVVPRRRGRRTRDARGSRVRVQDPGGGHERRPPAATFQQTGNLHAVVDQLICGDGGRGSMSETRPLIGVTTQSLQAVEGIPAAFPASWVMNRMYLDALVRAGAAPVLLPLLPDQPEVMRALYERLDGLLLPGGVDIEPSNFGEPRHELLRRTDPPRDAVELQLARWALGRRDAGARPLPRAADPQHRGGRHALPGCAGPAISARRSTTTSLPSTRATSWRTTWNW